MSKVITGTREDGDKFLRLIGPWCSEFETQLATGDWDMLSLFGADMASYEPLIPYAERIRWLRVSTGPDSSKGLDRLTHLEILTLDDHPQPAVDFRRLPRLRELEILWSSGRKTAYLANPGLESLIVTGFGDNDLSILQSLSDLSHLDLRQGSLKSLSGIEALGKLTHLRLIQLRNFNNISAIADCRKLLHLETDSLPKLLEVDAVKGLSNLTRLELDAVNAGIDNLDWLAGMPRLNRLMLSVRARDMDWRIIARHPALTWMAVTADEGYEVSDETIEAALRAGDRQPVNFRRLMGKVPGFHVEWPTED